MLILTYLGGYLASYPEWSLLDLLRNILDGHLLLAVNWYIILKAVKQGDD